MNRCILCGGRIGPKGWVWMNLYEPNKSITYVGAYVCRKCQHKYKIGPEHKAEIIERCYA